MHPKHKKCKRYNDPGHAHELTFTCSCNQAFLSKDRLRVWLVDAINVARLKHSFHVWAYVIMPEHAHLLIWPTFPECNVSKILATIKVSVTRRALKYVRRNAAGFLNRMKDLQPNGDVHYRFWQRGGGYDRNSTEPATILNQIVYIHANPDRRGLCRYAEDWMWSSAGFYAGLGDGPISIDCESLPRTRYG